eukprot:TRINITY_DN28127_c0_g1_i1.p1 TRINITY_DN28127_c0_g1~~TRINITY_DN28127_c0_g1_i1.p1  ORF type:complete len:387 (+),score=59.42 TRINITY_DN28127_c0_g1_i1:54-1214(+)
MRKFGISVWGGTGFTGKLIAEYLSHNNKGVTWALCGRNSNRLEEVASSLTGPSKPTIVIGDVENRSSLDALAANTEVMIAACGPYLQLGIPMFESCLEHKTHYVDINGETPFVKKLITDYDAEAKQKQLVMVPSCGFDSIPSDISSYFAAQQLLHKTGEPAAGIEGYFNMKGQLSGGTIATGIALEEGGFSIMKQVANPFLLSQSPKRPPYREEERDVKVPEYCERIGSWTAPFFMAPINTRIVRRSIEILSSKPDTPFTADTYYRERAVAGSEEEAVRLTQKIPLAKRKALVQEGKLPSQGSGPSEATRKASTFTAHTIATSSSGQSVQVVMSGGDPGYEETARMVSESALLILSGSHNNYFGIGTPAVAFGDQLTHALGNVKVA